VIEWFDRVHVEPLMSIPMVGNREFDEDTQLFEMHPMGTRLDRVATELNMLLEGGTDGGLYIMIGRKSGAAHGA